MNETELRTWLDQRRGKNLNTDEIHVLISLIRFTHDPRVQYLAAYAIAAKSKEHQWSAHAQLVKRTIEATAYAMRPPLKVKEFIGD